MMNTIHDQRIAAQMASTVTWGLHQARIDREARLADAQHTLTRIVNAAVVAPSNVHFVYVYGADSRTVHKVWLNGERERESRGYADAAIARNFMWQAAANTAADKEM